MKRYTIRPRGSEPRRARRLFLLLVVLSGVLSLVVLRALFDLAAQLLGVAP